MDLQPTDLQELLRTTAQDFLTREVPSARVREIQDAGEPDAELWKQIVELGWTGLPIVKEHGGQGAQDAPILAAVLKWWKSPADALNPAVAVHECPVLLYIRCTG